MPRPPRHLADATCYHIISRGNNRAAVFYADQDRQRYGQWLLAFSQEHGVAIYHYCWMTNHVHFVVHTTTGCGLRTTVQRLHRRYAQYLHHTYGHVGHVWQDRFKSVRLADDQAVLACGRYVERNPVDALMVTAPAAYPWSSARVYLQGHHDPLVTLNPAYLGLHVTPPGRRAAYQRYITTDAADYQLALPRPGRPRKAARVAVERSAA